MFSLLLLCQWSSGMLYDETKMKMDVGVHSSPKNLIIVGPITQSNCFKMPFCHDKERYLNGSLGNYNLYHIQSLQVKLTVVIVVSAAGIWRPVWRPV